MGRSATRRASAAHLLAAGVVGGEEEVEVVVMMATGQGQATQGPTGATAYATTQTEATGMQRITGIARSSASRLADTVSDIFADSSH